MDVTDHSMDQAITVHHMHVEKMDAISRKCQEVVIAHRILAKLEEQVVKKKFQEQMRSVIVASVKRKLQQRVTVVQKARIQLPRSLQEVQVRRNLVAGIAMTRAMKMSG